MELLSHAPRLDLEAARRLARDLYDVDAIATLLTSERDQNFLLTTASGERFVLKIANALEEPAQIDAQNQALAAVLARTPLVPRVVPTRHGTLAGTWNGGGETRHLVRLLTWLDGVALAEVKRHSPALLRDLGRAVASVDAALERFDHPAAHRAFHWDLAGGVATCRERVSRIGDAELRRTVERLLNEIEIGLAPLLPRLPKSVIHGDANDYNVIVGDPAGDARARRVAGLIDFGDMVHSYTVGGLAVAIAYAILDKADPLATAAEVVAGYHAARPLGDDEIAAIFDLVRLRLCLSACIGAAQIAERPGDPYLAVSQAPLRRTLPRLATIRRRLAEYTFRAACGAAPVPSGRAVSEWIETHAAEAAPVLGHDLRATSTTVLDLSVGSPLVSGDARENSEPVLSARIEAAMREAGATVGIGRYDEARLLYTSLTFAVGFGEAGSEVVRQRTVHLGIDLFAPAGTPVHAPIDGVVHAFANNAVPLDYGPVIVLEHQPAAGVRFFTVYGHLSVASLDGCHTGHRVARGDRIGTLGTPDVNGGWPPHLHFQVVTDLLDRGADFPGVADAEARTVWRSLSPDPSPLLHVAPASRAPETSIAAALSARQTATGRNVGLSYAQPVQVARGWMQYLFDQDGRRYLDAYNNVPHVGHSHPRVVRAVSDQLRVLNTNTRYLHDSLAELAAALTATLPAPLRVCYFVNSGSEANDLALRLARAHTRGTDVIVLEGAYHGITTTAIDISPYKHAGPGGSGAPPWVHAVPLPDDYRGRYRRDDPDAGPKFAEFVAEASQRATSRGGLAAFIAESCPSVGGQIILPPGYLAAAYRAVRAAGGVAVADEVQTAYGRLGTSFWGFEPHDVVPDIVVLGKPMGNGYPIGAVVTTPEIAASFDNGMEFFSTFGGSTAACAAGLAVLDVVCREDLQAHARRVGDRLLAQLRPLVDRHAIVGDVRGSGLFLGVELVRNRETLEPATAAASVVVNRLREEGILIGTDGPFHNVLKIRPPMPFNEGDGDRLVAALEQVLDEA